MFNWLRRRRLSSEARRKLLIAAARAEEAIVDTHVENIMDLLDLVGDEIDLDRGIELYQEMMALDETMAATVTNRALARHQAPAPRAGSAAERRFENVFRNEGPRR